MLDYDSNSKREPSKLILVSIQAFMLALEFLGRSLRDSGFEGCQLRDIGFGILR